MPGSFGRPAASSAGRRRAAQQGSAEGVGRGVLGPGDASGPSGSVPLGAAAAAVSRRSAERPWGDGWDAASLAPADAAASAADVGTDPLSAEEYWAQVEPDVRDFGTQMRDSLDYPGGYGYDIGEEGYEREGERFFGLR